jgi:hypothetical protein
MAIDRIGRGGTSATPGVDGSSTARPAGEAFEGARAPAAAAPGEAASSDAVDRLRAGTLDFEGYVRLKTEEATAHLTSLPPAQLESIRSALRERLATDPSLVDLVRMATGATAPSRGERDD